jgi:predicted alpha/beta-fold hydrolase
MNKSLLPASLMLYLLTLIAGWHGMALHTAVGGIACVVLLLVHLLQRAGWRWVPAGAAGLLLFFPAAVPAYVAVASRRRAGPLHPLHAAIATPVLFMVLLAGAAWLASASTPAPAAAAGSIMQLTTMPLATQSERKAAVLELLQRNPFRAPWWLSNAHAQTFWGPFMRTSLRVPYRSERWTTPDGDWIRLQFFDAAQPATEEPRPLVLLLHGLEGSAESPYIRGFNHAFHQLGWDAVTMEYRFCSGEPNTASRIYHMGETTDCDFVVRRLAAMHPGRPLFLCGFSLGGNVLAKWLGEQGEHVPRSVRAAAIISPPFDPLISAPDFHKILGGFYAWNFLRSLKPKALEKSRQFPGIIDEDVLLACKDFYTYDTIVTAALHGFDDAEDYWRRVGCHQFLPAIRIPTMLLTSADDPFNPPQTIPRAAADASPWLHPQWTERGGHVGFVMGPTPLRPRYWMEEQALTFFQAYHAIGRARAEDGIGAIAHAPRGAAS